MAVFIPPLSPLSCKNCAVGSSFQFFLLLFFFFFFTPLVIFFSFYLLSSFPTELVVKCINIINEEVLRTKFYETSYEISGQSLLKDGLMTF